MTAYQACAFRSLCHCQSVDRNLAARVFLLFTCCCEAHRTLRDRQLRCRCRSVLVVRVSSLYVHRVLASFHLLQTAQVTDILPVFCEAVAVCRCSALRCAACRLVNVLLCRIIDILVIVQADLEFIICLRDRQLACCRCNVVVICNVFRPGHNHYTSFCSDCSIIFADVCALRTVYNVMSLSFHQTGSSDSRQFYLAARIGPGRRFSCEAYISLCNSQLHRASCCPIFSEIIIFITTEFFNKVCFMVTYIRSLGCLVSAVIELARIEARVGTCCRNGTFKRLFPSIINQTTIIPVDCDIQCCRRNRQLYRRPDIPFYCIVIIVVSAETLIKSC